MLFHSTLGWAATHTHDFELKITKPFWPMFYSTKFFLPKIKIEIRNKGSKIDKASIEVETRKYDGELSDVTTIKDHWIDTGQEGRLNVTEWLPNQKKYLKIRIPSRNFPTVGTYIIRIKVLKWIPLGSIYEEIQGELKKGKLNRAEYNKIFTGTLKRLEGIGIDIHKSQPGSFKAEEIFDGKIVEYFKIEDLSNVMTFWSILGAALIAFLPYFFEIIESIIKGINSLF